MTGSSSPADGGVGLLRISPESAPRAKLEWGLGLAVEKKVSGGVWEEGVDSLERIESETRGGSGGSRRPESGKKTSPGSSDGFGGALG